MNVAVMKVETKIFTAFNPNFLNSKSLKFVVFINRKS